MDTTISRKNQSFLWTGKVSGYDTTIWKPITGTPTLSSDKIRINAAEITTFLALKNGDVEIGITVPTAPTAGDSRFFGIYSPTLSTKGKMLFSVEDDECFVLAHDDDGTEIFKEQIVWDSDWTNAEARYRISWNANQILFSVNGTIVYQTNDTVVARLIPSLPNNITIKNANSDNLDVSYLAIRTSSELNDKLISPGGGLATSAKQDAQTAILTTIDADTSAMVTDLAAIEVLQTAANASLDDIETVLEDVHNNPANLLRTAEQDPLNFAFQPEKLVAVTNGTDGTYTYYVDLATFRKGAIQLLLDGGSGSVTVTVEGSCQDDGTAPASCNYVDITNALFGAATFTASNILFDKEGYFTGLKYLKIKVVADTTGANNADWTIFVNKVW